MPVWMSTSIYLPYYPNCKRKTWNVMQMKPSVYGKDMKNKEIQSAIINGLVIQEKMKSKVCDCIYMLTIHLTQQITQPLISQDSGFWLQC